MSNYDQHPVIPISGIAGLCLRGWAEVVQALRQHEGSQRRRIIAVEVYPGIDGDKLAAELSQGLHAHSVLRTEEAFLEPGALRALFAETLRDDPVFGYMYPWTIDAYFDPALLRAQRQQIADAEGILLVIGAGASWIVERPDLLISANLGRWQIQQRQRAHAAGNLGFNNDDASPGELYKTAFFLDWRVADRCRHRIYPNVDFFMDLTDAEQPTMLAGKNLRAAVHTAVQRPFRTVPFFDPGPWGGQWMRAQFGLPSEPPNFAWGFDCVPEENTVLLGFGDRTFQLPAILLVHEQPEALLGANVFQRFGAEFPIRFDLLDTVRGGNLSLQVHPNETYIRDHFGMPYTQDESYYMLHCEPGSNLFLGLKEAAEREPMSAALQEALRGGAPFPAEQFIAQWPTAKHDHFSIPAGTVHCSGAGNVVLEISATPYIFTFKLWDWGRTGLDGHPRPIHLDHGLANIRWDRTADWVRRELIQQTKIVRRGDGWREERTGLHATQFLETHRHWFTAPVPHQTDGNLQVLNLVEGNEAVVSSPHGAFAPWRVHYAETFIVPACVGEYTIAPITNGPELGTLKAYVRP
jgi:mannose-6-phosphate isomerase class I